MAEPKVTGQFLAGPGGPLATLVWDPPAPTAPRFAVLYVAPFADEMNKSRRMAALQARALARIGGSVAIVDWRGTGDSGGGHGGATWEGWHDDLRFAWSWLGQRSGTPCLLWGLRLGALLALDAAARKAVAPAAFLLWQPVASGRAYFNQALRVATIQERLSESGGVDAKGLRAALAANQSIEVAGYEINPALVSGAECVDLAALDNPGCPVIWREVSISASRSPLAQRIEAQWKGEGAEVDVAAVAGAQFWATQEIAEAPELLAATTAAIESLLPNLARLHA